MRFIIDAYHALFPSGGIARYARELISAIADISVGDELVLFYNLFREDGDVWKPSKGIAEIYQFRFPRRLLQGAWRNFKWPPIESFCGSCDLFHGLHFILPPVRRAVRVLTVHDLTYLRFGDYFAERKLNEHGYRRELPRALAQADMVIAVSQKTRDDLIELMDFPADRVRVIYEGVDHRLFTLIDQQSAAPIQKIYGINRPYLIFLVGTPEPRKNLKRTITAVRQVAPDFDLVVVGPKAPLKKMLSDHVSNLIFTGVVPENHLPALLSRAVISLYPSLYEGFGLPVLESMACGVPVVTSTQGALPEVAGGAALLVDPEDVGSIAGAISELIDNDALQKHLKAAGQQRASEFTWQNTAAQTLSLYQELI